MQGAATAAGITVPEVARNIQRTLQGAAPYASQSMHWWLGKEQGGHVKPAEQALRTAAQQKFPGDSEQQDKYVYGALWRLGWKPGRKRFRKHAEDEYAMTTVVKAAEEQRYTLGVAYPANKADVSRAADGHRDFVSPEVLEKTAWTWMAQHRDINLFHQDGTSGHAAVVESYIYRGPDWTLPSPVDGKPYVVKKGDWMLGTVWDHEGWALVKQGLVKGWSPEGGARRGTATADKLAALRT